KLVESGDRVAKIEGCPSGTLGYLFGELGRATRFSEALRGAIAQGYPEPDPREDLSGMDVARKALILGRLLGFSGELGDIAVESLVPQGAEQLSLEGFLARLDEYDQAWVRRVAAARDPPCSAGGEWGRAAALVRRAGGGRRHRSSCVGRVALPRDRAPYRGGRDPHLSRRQHPAARAPRGR